ncbi:MAG: glycosyltransferase family 1 protein [Candidatus Sungbacteria bacterium]|nr:glycosyltransferase family 1 protein [Candidatus Sungbacteria bacterium]
MEKLKKIIIVPPDPIIEKEPSQPVAAFFARSAKYFKRRLWQDTSVYDGELQFYADMPAFLGESNVYVFGKYLPHFYSPKVPAGCAYPSCHGIPRSTYVPEKELEGVIKEADAVLISTRSSKKRRELAGQLAKKNGIPVAMIDFKDHYSVFAGQAADEEICRGFKRGNDYDLYFKKDLPLGRRSDVVLPLAPVPVRPESYRFNVLSKDVDIFYSGKIRQKGTGDRGDIVDLVKNQFPSSVVFEHVDHHTFLSLRSYLDNLSRAKIALSPSGVVWDSFRHCEVGLAPQALLLAPKPYMEVVGPFLEDGVNAVLYETEFRDGKYHLINSNELIEKIKYYLSNDDKRVRIANNWAGNVKAGHTGVARSRYIAESIDKIL